MLKKIGILALSLSAIAFPALADSYRTIPNPTSVWDTSTGTLYAIGTPGNTAKSLIPGYGLANTWTGLNNSPAPSKSPERPRHSPPAACWPERQTPRP